MRPIIVFPFHDPDKVTFRHFKAITPILKEVFSGATIGITHITLERCPEQIDAIEKDSFYKPFHLPLEGGVGDQFAFLYREAVSACSPEQILHLAFIDRLAFILQSSHRSKFIEDVRAIQSGDTPLIFSRSEKAWASHPRNYYEIESMVTTAGRLLFKKELDFAWCHLVVQAGQLRRVLPSVRNRDLSMVAELVLGMKDEVMTKEVNWLAWEDPFIFGRDPKELKAEREQSQEEAQKRFSYVLPMLQLLSEAARDGNK
jgi:hypothetical protein